MLRLLKSCFLLVVSGGGQIDDYWGGPFGHPYSLFKWAVLARLANVPMVVLSVGVCSLASRLSRLFVRLALQLAAYRSFRDRGSKELLAWTGFTAVDPVLPDLAFSYSPGSAAGKGAETDGSPLRIGVSPIAYLLSGHWPVSDDRFFASYFHSLIGFAEQLLREGNELVLFSTDDPDWDVVQQLSDRLQLADGPLRPGKLASVKLESVEQVVSTLSALDCVVASRLHGIILAHLCQKPTLAISYDRKVTDYMRDAGQPEYCLDIHQLADDCLPASFGRLAAGRRILARRIAQGCSKNSALLVSQYDEAAAIARNWIRNGHGQTDR